MKQIFAHILTVLLLVAFSGCSQQESGGQPTDTEMSRKIDRLRSLPYADGTSIPANESANVVRFDKERTCPGYRLYTIQKLGRAELIDEEGDLLRSWQYQPKERWERAELLPNGDLLVIGMEYHQWKDGGPQNRIADSSRYVMRLDWSGRLVWRKKLLAHHDIELTPDGRLLALTFKRRMVSDIDPVVETRDDHLTLLEQDGTVAATRSMLDAVQKNPSVFPLQPVTQSTRGGPPWVDLFHSNSMEWMHHESLFSKHLLYGPDNILVCFRHQDRVAIFNWSENKVLWSWGQGQVSGPHDAQVLDNGNVLLFDNGLGRDWSRAIEVNPLNGEILWQYKADPPQSFYTRSKGSAQRLPNGNTLLAESDRGRAIEVTAEGDVVWEFLCPHRLDNGKRAAMVRMIWHPREFIDNLLEQSE